MMNNAQLESTVREIFKCYLAGYVEGREWPKRGLKPEQFRKIRFASYLSNYLPEVWQQFETSPYNSIRWSIKIVEEFIQEIAQ